MGAARTRLGTTAVVGPPPGVAEVRSAVRSCAAEIAEQHPDESALVLVACSGGADSLGLAAATAFEASRGAQGARGSVRFRAGAIVVDHGLQAESRVQAEHAALQCRELGLDPVLVRTVHVQQGAKGPEAAARLARYAAFADALADTGAVAVWLGHTRDDQAEQVLLGLVRGSGARSLAGMPRQREHVWRPLLGVARATIRASCEELGLSWWEDPHNSDEAYTRVRARKAVFHLEATLGPGVVDALARSADLLRVDADALDGIAETTAQKWGPPPWPVRQWAEVSPAVRGRLWRRMIPSTASPLTARHVAALETLITDWHGQGPVSLPGGGQVWRETGRICCSPAP